MFITPCSMAYRNPCHPYGMFMPVTPLFTGAYDDYGNLEDIEIDPVPMGILASCLLRRRHDDSSGPEDLDLSSGLGSDQAYAESLQAAIDAACSMELYGMFADPGRQPEWRPVYAVFLKKQFVDLLIKSRPADPEYVGSTSFRLTVAGPMRDALRALDPNWGPYMDGPVPVIERKHADQLCSLVCGMGAMRIPFAPTCGAGGQDAMDEPWQRRFMLSVWAASEALPHRYSEYPVAPFLCSEAWDGSRIASAKNDSAAPEFMVLDSASQDEMFATILETCAGNVLSAMDESCRKQEGGA